MLEDIRDKVKNFKYKVIAFDLDGTLYSSNAGIERQIVPAIHKVTKSKFNLSSEEAGNLLSKYNDQYGYFVHGFEKHHNVPAKDFINEVYMNIDRSGVSAYDGLKESLELLSSFTEKLIVFTNCAKIHAEKILDIVGIYKLFNLIIGIEDLDFLLKPDLKAYKKFLEISNVHPEEILYFDDSVRNIQSAWKLNIDSILVSNGIVQEPYFWEMHLMIEHTAPYYAKASSHNIVKTINGICNFKE